MWVRHHNGVRNGEKVKYSCPGSSTNFHNFTSKRGNDLNFSPMMSNNLRKFVDPHVGVLFILFPLSLSRNLLDIPWSACTKWPTNLLNLVRLSTTWNLLLTNCWLEVTFHWSAITGRNILIHLHFTKFLYLLTMRCEVEHQNHSGNPS